MNNLKSLITTIILAGGKSSRMGTDKALIEINGVPLLRKICDLAQQCSSQVYIVTPWQEKYKPILANNYQIIPEKALPGEILPHGALVGFAQGLIHVKTEWVLLLACDLPCLNLEQLQQWSQLILETPEETIALVPKQSQGWECLCAFYRRNCLESLNKFIAQGGRSFQIWLSEIQVQELPITDIKTLFNCNTPEDLQTLNLG